MAMVLAPLDNLAVIIPALLALGSWIVDYGKG